ncbi:MAG: TetR/AcrR family transcriptional regulator [Aestuariivirga sp.]
MTDQSVTKARQRRPDARPAEILGAALELFAEKGFSGTRLEDVAARAGLSKAAIYLYFDGKMDLLRALVQEMAGANLAVAGSIAQGHVGEVAPLLRQILVFMSGQLRHTRFPELMKVVISESRAHPEIGQLYLDNVIRHGLPLFEGLIARGVAAGEFRSLDPSLAAKSLISPMLLAAIWKTVFEPLGAETLDTEGLARQHVDILLKGMAP